MSKMTLRIWDVALFFTAAMAFIPVLFLLSAPELTSRMKVFGWLACTGFAALFLTLVKTRAQAYKLANAVEANESFIRSLEVDIIMGLLKTCRHNLAELDMNFPPGYAKQRGLGQTFRQQTEWTIESLTPINRAELRRAKELIIAIQAFVDEQSKLYPDARILH